VDNEIRTLFESLRAALATQQHILARIDVLLEQIDHQRRLERGEDGFDGS
jgi:hypothetical protein